MIERSLLPVVAVLASFGLSGCISTGGYSQTAAAQQPSQEILDGTIRDPADWPDTPRPIVRRSAKVTIGSVKTATDPRLAASSAEAPAVYSDEWWVKENRENDLLKNRMQICRGC